MLAALILAAQTAAATTTPSAPATHTSETALAPAGKWVVNYSTDGCLVSRQFGDENGPLTFGFRLWPMATSAEILLIGNPGLLRLPSEGTIEIAGDTVPPVRDNDFQSWKPNADASKRTVYIRLAYETLSNMVPSHKWIFRHGKQTIALQTGPMTALLNVIHDCEANLLKTWNIDPSRLDDEAARATPIGSPEHWFHADDYPSIGGSNDISARVTVFLSIDATGRVSDCRPLGKATGYDFEKVTCNIFRSRGRYQPPHNAQNQPVASYEIESVRWTLW
jgi:hypothetical protein